ncbi:MAG: hypothetical protein PVG66_12700 [Chromatiales bacterium]|jgi:tetratricopeptide (TPR) repeat protein
MPSAFVKLSAGFLLLSLLSACANLTSTQTVPPVAENSSQAINQAKQLQQQGDWANALSILRQAAKQQPDDQAITTALQQMEQGWNITKQTLKHRILISETRALLEQKPLLEQITAANPSDLSARARSVIVDLHLNGKTEPLSHCAEFQQQHNLQLAVDCSELLNRISGTDSSEKNYQATLKQYQQVLAKSKQSLQQRQQRSMKKNHNQLVEQASELIDTGRYLEAQVLLEEVLRNNPQHANANKLMPQLRTEIDEQINMLLSVGDQLYREGKLEQAISAWQSLLRFDPEHAQAKTKIERARHVISKLETLRKQQTEP